METLTGVQGQALSPSLLSYYVLSGPVGVSASGREDATVNLMKTHVLKIATSLVEESRLDQEIKQFWDLETLGIKVNEPTVHERFSKDIKFVEGRYCTK